EMVIYYLGDGRRGAGRSRPWQPGSHTAALAIGAFHAGQIRYAELRMHNSLENRKKPRRWPNATSLSDRSLL
ncbi:MAG: hypothetical protein LC799_17010, partial [Actinobacteria bacterium]|nr:hypothetical protein [Actinomycetota bacterium]